MTDVETRDDARRLAALAKVLVSWRPLDDLWPYLPPRPDRDTEAVVHAAWAAGWLVVDPASGQVTYGEAIDTIPWPVLRWAVDVVELETTGCVDPLSRPFVRVKTRGLS